MQYNEWVAAMTNWSDVKDELAGEWDEWTARAFTSLAGEATVLEQERLQAIMNSDSLKVCSRSNE